MIYEKPSDRLGFSIRARPPAAGNTNFVLIFVLRAA
jgi:hypothetical protein